ncbi:DUF6220 domain-containing protein, partial [Actinoplanes sp. NPDC048791]|uniref:DUF6220 domain-containing protein n=1 Tax=Actinoplanes sp. NPDC048791 TaxID=3154623 RepID=UPI00340699E2
MRKVFVVSSTLVVIVVLTQFYLAGVGGFSRPATTDSWTAHRAGALAVMVAVLLNIVVAALARAGPQNVSAVATRLNLDGSTVTRQVGT